jgi:ATP-dependent Lon protease
MKTKDSSTSSVSPVDQYWITTVLEDRAESAGAPMPAADKKEATMPMPKEVAAFLLSPDINTAIKVAMGVTPRMAGVKTARAKQWAPKAPYQSLENAKKLYDASKPVAALMWMFLSLRPGDENIPGIVKDAEDYCRMPETVSAALRIWREIADGKRAIYGTDIFAVVHKSRLSKMKDVPVFDQPQGEANIAIELLRFARWDVAARWLYRMTSNGVLDREQLMQFLSPAHLANFADRSETRTAIYTLADHMFGLGRPEAGQMAFGWLMLACDPKLPTTFNYVAPQLSYLLARETSLSADEAKELHQTVDVWFRCCNGEFAHSEFSAFTIASDERRNFPDPDVEQDKLGFERVRPVTRWQENRPAAKDTWQPLHSIAVVIGGRAMEPSLPAGWKDMAGKKLPMVVVNDIAGIRARLHAEYPHAQHVVDSLLRDLRDGQPVRLQPVVLLGPPGTGKSRFVRSLASEISRAAGVDLHVARFDAAASHDAMWSGSPKTWSSSMASVPARAVLRSQIANPIVMIDEVEKSGSGTYNGRLWDAMHPFLERETSARYPETGLGDVELDLSWVNYIATANSLDGVPATLIDRFRVLKVPSPTLQHLPALAAVVMRDLAKHDDARAYDEPLAADELAVIGRVWRAEKFSMRKLQRLVATTLEVRDTMARRH